MKLTIVLIISHFLTSAKFREFRRKRQIPQLGSKFRGPQKTVGPTYKCARQMKVSESNMIGASIASACC